MGRGARLDANRRRARAVARVMRIDALLEAGAPGAVALVAGDARLTFAELALRAAAAAARLVAGGVRPGDRVAIHAPKSLAMVLWLFAVWRAGAVAVPVNPVLRPGQVGHIVADSGARLLIAPGARLGALAGVAAGVERWAIEPLPEGADALPPVPVAADALAALLYTSGSTGRPKGVMLSHANLWHAADAVRTYLGLAADDVALAVLPLSFDAGLSVLTSALAAGGSAVLLDYLAPADVVRAVARYGVTTLSGVPPLFVQLAEVTWPEATTLRRITVTGGRMPVALSRRYRAAFPAARLHLMYGLTEAFRSLSLDPALVDLHPTSVGTPIPHAEVRLVRADGSECAEGEPGELVHAGPLVAQGYWGDAERTAERFRPVTGFAQGGAMAVWSGDTLVRRGGLYYFLGRDDEMIKVSGMRVSPTEIEEAAVATGAAGEAVALGIDDARLGQAIVLVASPAAGLGKEAAAAGLAAGLAAALPGYMRPARVIWRDALPRNANGKLDRVALRAEVGG